MFCITGRYNSENRQVSKNSTGLKQTVRQLHQMRPHMLDMEELLNQSSVEITRDRTVKLFISKKDLDYAHGQMRLSEETSRQCLFALTGGKLSGYYRFKKGCYGFADIPTKFQEKIDRTLEYFTLA